MRVEYSKRAVSDLRKIAADSRTYGDAVTAAVAARIRDIVAYIADHPEAAPPIAGRPGMRVMPLMRYPYKIFYRILEDRVRILHIHHAARRPWTLDR
jgi:plasmid stabilization system protein ParE